MDYIGKREMLTGILKHFCTKVESNKLFVHMKHFWDLLFQRMKHGTNTLHVAFIYIFPYTMVEEETWRVVGGAQPM
jgi:hypothetical protein